MRARDARTVTPSIRPSTSKTYRPGGLAWLISPSAGLALRSRSSMPLTALHPLASQYRPVKMYPGDGHLKRAWCHHSSQPDRCGEAGAL